MRLRRPLLTQHKRFFDEACERWTTLEKMSQPLLDTPPPMVSAGENVLV
jgi:hypothetical protein